LPPAACGYRTPVVEEERKMGESRNRPMPAAPSAPLSGLQLELLKLYSTEMTTEELLEVKQLLARYFARKAVESADQIWDQRQLTDEDMDAWLHE
jgi:hypothetical protein